MADTSLRGNSGIDDMPMRQRRLFSGMLIVFLLAGIGIYPSPAYAQPSLPLSAGSALLLDAQTHRLLYAKNPHTRRPPGSTAKVMTALVVLERLPLRQIVRIPSWVKSIEPSKAYLRPGEHYRARDLLRATLISSSNDAAEVLGVATAGSQEQFARWMNAKARKIGARNTNFTTASGLPRGNQYSTAYDLALIMKEAQENDFVVDALRTKYGSIRSIEGRKISLKNHNKLLWKDRRPLIGKTGYTRKGRYCFVGGIQWMGRDVLVSLLGSHRLWTDLKILLDYQFGAAISKIKKNRKLWSQAQTNQIQAALARSGFSPGPLDGKFGPKTLRAVEAFQKHHKLKPDGIVGPKTCLKLKVC